MDVLNEEICFGIVVKHNNIEEHLDFALNPLSSGFLSLSECLTIKTLIVNVSISLY